jgi:hypothetical protein
MCSTLKRTFYCGATLKSALARGRVLGPRRFIRVHRFCMRNPLNSVFKGEHAKTTVYCRGLLKRTFLLRATVAFL